MMFGFNLKFQGSFQSKIYILVVSLALGIAQSGQADNNQALAELESWVNQMGAVASKIPVVPTTCTGLPKGTNLVIGLQSIYTGGANSFLIAPKFSVFVLNYGDIYSYKDMGTALKHALIEKSLGRHATKTTSRLNSMTLTIPHRVMEDHCLRNNNNGDLLVLLVKDTTFGEEPLSAYPLRAPRSWRARHDYSSYLKRIKEMRNSQGLFDQEYDNTVFELTMDHRSLTQKDPYRFVMQTVKNGAESKIFKSDSAHLPSLFDSDLFGRPYLVGWPRGEINGYERVFWDDDYLASISFKTWIK